MPTECVIDAHALIWFIEGNPKLGGRARAAMMAPDVKLVIPAIALAEACWVAEKRTTNIPSSQHLLSAIDGDSRMSVDPIDHDLVKRTIKLLSIPEMHDRLIVATAIRRIESNPSAVLISVDSEISASKLVPLLWA